MDLHWMITIAAVGLEALITLVGAVVSDTPVTPADTPPAIERCDGPCVDESPR